MKKLPGERFGSQLGARRDLRLTIPVARSHYICPRRNRRLQFQERSQLLIRMYNETLSVVTRGASAIQIVRQ